MASFKELEVFQRAIAMVKYIYALTRDFPDEERYALVGQLRRATVGIPSSIAEGSARRTASERKHYIDIALGSLNEVYAQLIVAEGLAYIKGNELQRFEKGYTQLRAQLIAYQHAIKTRPTPNS